LNILNRGGLGAAILRPAFSNNPFWRWFWQYVL